MTPQHAFVMSELVQPAGLPAIRAQLAKLRADSLNAGEMALVDHSEGRALVESKTNPEEGRALLRKAIATRADDPDALRARSYSFAVLVDEAGRSHDWKNALSLLAEEHGADAATSCMLGASEETGTVFVARAADGHDVGAYLPRELGEHLGQHVVPGEILGALGGCATVDVFARQPYYGRATLLPSTMTWRFRGSGHAAAKSTGPSVVVANVLPPPSLHLAPLNPVEPVANAAFITGGEATPSRAIDAFRDAGYIEIDSHGMSDGDDEAALLVMSPDPSGSYALTSSAIAKTKLHGHPVVVLAACGAGAVGHSFRVAYGLADAFLIAGATAVIASPEPIADAAAPKFFADLRSRLTTGEEAARALDEVRREWKDPAQRTWIDKLVVFE